MKSKIFHLAIPCRDLEEARQFYVDQLGAELARSYDDRVTLKFFGHQVVCHLAPDKIDPEPQLYPRHFGITFRDMPQFEALIAGYRQSGLEFFREPYTRFGGTPAEHLTFFLRDPSNNLIEFKCYLDERMMY
jgi:hypothetical protein